MFTGLFYAAVSDQKVAVAVRSQGKWYNTTTQGWETPFNPANHTIVTTATSDFPTIWEATIPPSALVPGSYVVEFTVSGTTYVPASVVCAPQNYVGAIPVRGSLSLGGC